MSIRSQDIAWPVNEMSETFGNEHSNMAQTIVETKYRKDWRFLRGIKYK